MPKKNNNCSICGNRFDTKISLGAHPCADTFLKKQRTAKMPQKERMRVWNGDLKKMMSSVNPTSRGCDPSPTI